MPLFFAREADGIPAGWLERVRHNLATIPPRFNTDRMVKEYCDKAYRRLGDHHQRMMRDRKTLAKSLARSTSAVSRSSLQAGMARETLFKMLMAG